MHHVVKEKELAGMTIMVHILQAKQLVARDVNIIGRSTTSDPYCEAFYNSSDKETKLMGKTKTIHKTLAPAWNETLSIDVGADEACDILNGTGNLKTLTLQLFDEDTLTDNDPMGTVTIPIVMNAVPTPFWYPVEEGEGEHHCEDAAGKVEVVVLFQGKKLMDVTRGQELKLNKKNLEISMSYAAQEKIALDTSLVAVNEQGAIVWEESAHYGNFTTSAIQYNSFDGSDETFSLKLEDIPTNVVALYMVYSCSSSTFSAVNSAEVRFLCLETGEGICRSLVPQKVLQTANATSIVLARLERSDIADSTSCWRLAPIQDAYSDNVRDFGSLLPQLQSYSRVVDHPASTAKPTAVLRRDGGIRLGDYCCASSSVPECLVFSVAWEGFSADQKELDLDAAVIMLDANMQRQDIVYYGNLQSQDGSINHTGDAHEVEIVLSKIRPDCQYLGFVVNSIGGHVFDGTKQVSCRLYDADNNSCDEGNRGNLARYALCRSEELEDRTAIVMACLSRDDGGEWGHYRIVSVPALGERPHDNVDEMQEWLDRHSLENTPMSKPSSSNDAAATMQEAVEVFEDDVPVPQMHMNEYM